jgi:transcription elongation factor GreB
LSRYRPPSPPKSPYISAAGAAILKQELDTLWRIERPKVTDAVREAAKNGDRSENGDYIYGKRRLREIDSRVRYLTKRLETLKVISEPPADQSKVFFGATVQLEDDKAGSKPCILLAQMNWIYVPIKSASTPPSPARCSASKWTMKSNLAPQQAFNIASLPTLATIY